LACQRPSTHDWPKIEESQNHFSEWTVIILAEATIYCCATLLLLAAARLWKVHANLRAVCFARVNPRGSDDVRAGHDLAIGRDGNARAEDGVRVSAADLHGEVAQVLQADVGVSHGSLFGER